MKTSRSEIERLVPLLRQIARALVERHRADVADDLVHEALDDIVHSDRTWAAGEVETRLLARLVIANRARVRAEADERHTLPELSARGAGPTARSGPSAPASRGAGHGLDSLPLGDREVLALVVLARIEYTKAADILGIPLATAIARLTHARDTLGTALWATPASPQRVKLRAAGHHLRLVKS